MKRIITLSLVALTLVLASGCKPRVRVKQKWTYRPAKVVVRQQMNEEQRRELQRKRANARWNARRQQQQDPFPSRRRR